MINIENLITTHRNSSTNWRKLGEREREREREIVGLPGIINEFWNYLLLYLVYRIMWRKKIVGEGAGGVVRNQRRVKGVKRRGRG